MVYKVIVFILISCFYSAYFYKQVSLKKKGINANRLAKGIKSKRTAAIEKVLLIATYVAVIVQYGSVFLLPYIMPLNFIMPLRIVGVVLTFCGVVLFIAAVLTMRDNWRAGIDETQKTNIVKKGIYKYSRNPAFLGFDLLYIGTAFALPNIIMIVAAIFCVIVIHTQILEEEKYLSKVFSGEYENYKKHTPRYCIVKK